jgi:hypothetical protein
MQLHDPRVGWGGKSKFKGAPNTGRGWTINHEMKNFNRKRGQQSTKDKLVLLFPSQERLAGFRIEGSRDSRSCTG